MDDIELLCFQLMKPWYTALHLCEFEVTDFIEKYCKSKNLPNKSCVNCGKEISWWEYASNQGWCDECVNKWLEEESKKEY